MVQGGTHAGPCIRKYFAGNPHPPRWCISSRFSTTGHTVACRNGFTGAQYGSLYITVSN